MSNTIAIGHAIGRANRRPFRRLVVELGRRVRAMRARQTASRELAAMSAVELADMGITRHDLPRLVAPESGKPDAANS